MGRVGVAAHDEKRRERTAAAVLCVNGGANHMRTTRR